MRASTHEETPADKRTATHAQICMDSAVNTQRDTHTHKYTQAHVQTGTHKARGSGRGGATGDGGDGGRGAGGRGHGREPQDAAHFLGALADEKGVVSGGSHDPVVLGATHIRLDHSLRQVLVHGRGREGTGTGRVRAREASRAPPELRWARLRGRRARPALMAPDTPAAAQGAHADVPAIHEQDRQACPGGPAITQDRPHA